MTVDTSPLKPQELALVEGERPSSASEPNDPGWQAVMPVPDDAPAPPDDSVLYGKPSMISAYRDKLARVNFLIERFDHPDGTKEFHPLSLFRHRRGFLKWRYKAVPAPFPLYGLDALAARPDAQVLVTEGEKTADAARVLFPEMVVVTSPFGAGAAAKADWSPLAGRDVVIWPDNDEAGATYASAVAFLAHKAGAASVKIVEVS